MAWHEAWESDNISINQVKFLIADVCNAIQERYRLVRQEEFSFPLLDDEESEDPTSEDLVGLFVDARDENGIDRIIAAIVDALTDLLPYPGHSLFFTNDDFTVQYTLETACIEVGILDHEEVIEAKRWKTRDWWFTVKGLLELCRYAEFQCGLDLEEGTTLATDEDLDGNENSDGMLHPNTPQETWDTFAPGDEEDLDVMLSPGNFVGYLATGNASDFGAFVSLPRYYADVGGDGQYYYDHLKFIGCESYTVIWDSDYKKASSSPYEGFAAEREFPPPKTACLSDKTKVVFVPGVNGFTWTNGFGGSDPNKPDTSPLFELDGEFAGNDFTFNPFDDVEDDNNEFIMALGASGSEEIAVTIPPTIPAFLPVSGSSPADGSGLTIIAMHNIFRVGDIYARFDLNSAFNYQAE